MTKQRRFVALYSSAGDTITHFRLDTEHCILEQRTALLLPSVVQYAAAHPGGRVLYAATSDSEPGSRTINGQSHWLCALGVAADGALSSHGAPRSLRQRPIHASVDRNGKFVIVCYNAPPNVSVHEIRPDGTLGDEVAQPATLDVGFFPHQIQMFPSNRTALLVARGNRPSATHPSGEPGALRLMRFEQGLLASRASISPGSSSGLGYGPRHAAFHPVQPWVYVMVELQNALHMHRFANDVLEAEPAFALPSTHADPVPGARQVGGAVHVHPRGHVVYLSNRVSAATHPVGPFPFEHGENNIAVFSIDPATGEPSPIQFADPHGFHIRSFTIEPGGRVLAAASLVAMETNDADGKKVVPAGLSLFRIGADGRLSYERRHEIKLAPGAQQMWVGSLALPDGPH